MFRRSVGDSRPEIFNYALRQPGLTRSVRMAQRGTVVAIAERIRLMSDIDGVIEQHGGWPAAFFPDSSASTDISEART